MNGNNNINEANGRRIIISEELKSHVIQLRSRDDPETTQWLPTNEHAVACGIFFIDENQPSGDYELLSTPALNQNFSGRTLKACMCRVTAKDAEAEKDKPLIFRN